MTRNNFGFVQRLALLAAVLTIGAPATVLAQGGDGFMFKRPNVTLKFESGYGFARASSDLFDQVIADHTLERRDFDSPYVGGELAVRVAERWDVAINVGYQSTSTASEYRDWVDQDDLPITQVTDFHQIPATLSAKYYLSDRGRSIGRFAWIPKKIVPFVGGGVGLVSFDFEQHGDFVDFQTLDIFSDDLYGDGQAFLARASAGVHIALGHQFLFSAEGRYGWASGDMSGDFFGFDRMDLDGLQLVGGLAVRF